MGAFWDAWNKQGAANNAEAMAGMQQAQGLAALMKQGQEAQMQQGIRGILGSDAPMETKLQGLMQFGPAGVQVAHQIGVLNEQTQKIAKAKRVEDFWANEAPKFNTPAQPALQGNMTPTGGMMGFQSGEQEDAGLQGILSPAKPAGVDLEGLLNRGAQVGAVNPEALVNHRAVLAQREADRQTRLDGIKLQIADRQQRGEDTLALRESLAAMQRQSSADNIRLAASLRQPVQPSPPVVVPDGSGGFKYVTREQAIGQPAPAPSASLRIESEPKKWAASRVKEYKQDPEVAKFHALSTPVETIAPYMQRMSKPGASSDNVEDLNLTKLYLGITQQRGERLTNMDKKGLTQLASLDARFGNAISSFINGKDLTDQVRNDMWKTVVGTMSTLQKTRDARKQELFKRADANGVDRSLLFGASEE